ncbi:MAG: hypothetical protein V3S55_03855 [Nitrospiraceae bacterium]
MLILPNCPRLIAPTARVHGASRHWRKWPDPPAPALELGLVEQYNNAYSSYNTWSSIVLPLTDVKSGDVLIAELSIDSDLPGQWSMGTYDTGWVLKGWRSNQYGGGATLMKVCDGTETSPTSMGFTGSGTTQSWAYHVYRVEGADPSTTPHAFGQNYYGSNSTWFGTPSLTSTVSGCLWLSHVMAAYPNGTFTVPAPWTEEYDSTTGGGTGNWHSHSGASYLKPGIGADRPIHTCSISVKRGYLSLIVLKPAGT